MSAPAPVLFDAVAVGDELPRLAVDVTPTTVVLGAPTELRLVEDEEAAAPHRTLSALREREREARRLEAINRARSHPRVVDAIEVLGARLKEVKLAEG